MSSQKYRISLRIDRIIIQSMPTAVAPPENCENLATWRWRYLSSSQRKIKLRSEIYALTCPSNRCKFLRSIEPFFAASSTATMVCSNFVRAAAIVSIWARHWVAISAGSGLQFCSRAILVSRPSALRFATDRIIAAYSTGVGCCANDSEQTAKNATMQKSGLHILHICFSMNSIFTSQYSQLR